MKAAQISCACGQKYGGVSIRPLHTSELGSNGFQGLVPGNPLECAFSPSAHPFHRVRQAIRMMDVFSIRPAPQTGSELFGLGCVISFDPFDLSAFNVQSERASAPAIESGRSPDDPPLT
jgi:hypothetical protein